MTTRTDAPSCPSNRIRYQTAERARHMIDTGTRQADPGWVLVVDPCHECGGFHISQIPKPPERDEHAAYAGCIYKKAYQDERFARQVAQKILEERGTVLRVYQCPHCSMFHLTKRETYE